MVSSVLIISGHHDAVISVYAAFSGRLSFLEMTPIHLSVRLVAYTLSVRLSLAESSKHKSLFI